MMGTVLVSLVVGALTAGIALALQTAPPIAVTLGLVVAALFCGTRPRMA